MNIALLGYGKMGKAIASIAIAKGHTIGLKTNSSEELDFSDIDVAIDFSLPEAAFKNITSALEAGVPVVSGTTGWLNDYSRVEDYTREVGGAFLYASNFSIGVNLFFEFNKKLAKLMQGHKGYAAEMTEIHHTQKLDAPSGTAITLAEGIITNNNDYKAYQLVEGSKVTTPTLPIVALRQGQVPGTHTVAYKSEIDTITITHEAHSRAGFAQGALMAAEWITNKKGVFTMKDVLNIS